MRVLFSLLEVQLPFGQLAISIFRIYKTYLVEITDSSQDNAILEFRHIILDTLHDSRIL